jgi:RHS repeat-associated protein
MPQTINGSGENATFDYGPTHQYWRQTYSGSSGNETTYYLNKLVEKVDTAAGSDWRHFIVAPSGVVAIYSRQSSGTNTLRYILSDHQGSVASLLTSAGTTDVNESFAPFGARRNPATWSGAPTSSDQTLINGVTRVGYTGHTMLGNLGLIHMNGRVQDSTLGRFLSADPYVTDPLSTQSFNRYSYVLNNALSYVDPSGFDCEVYSGQPCEPNANGTCPPGSSPVRDQNGKIVYCVKDVTVTATPLGPSSPVGVFLDPGHDRNDDPGSHAGGSAPLTVQLETVQVTAKRMIPCDQLKGASGTIEPLLYAANQAYSKFPLHPYQRVWPFSAWRGGNIHWFFGMVVSGYGPPYTAADLVSYKNGVIVPYGTPGSVRPDATVGPLPQPWYVVELKSGFTPPSPLEIANYNANLPTGTPVCAIVEGIGPP